MSAIDINTSLAKQVIIGYRQNLGRTRRTGRGVGIEEAIGMTVQDVLDQTSFPVHRKDALLKYMTAIINEYLRQELAVLEDSFALD